jgi:hypothetical protein
MITAKRAATPEFGLALESSIDEMLFSSRVSWTILDSPMLNLRKLGEFNNDSLLYLKLRLSGSGTFAYNIGVVDPRPSERPQVN